MHRYVFIRLLSVIETLQFKFIHLFQNSFFMNSNTETYLPEFSKLSYQLVFLASKWRPRESRTENRHFLLRRRRSQVPL